MELIVAGIVVIGSGIAVLIKKKQEK